MLERLGGGGIADVARLVEGAGELKLAAAFLGSPAADVVDHEAAHRPGGIGEEMPAVREVEALARGDVEVGLVEERGGAERDLGAAPSELPLGDAVQFAIKGGEQGTRRCPIAAIRGADKLADRRVHRIPSEPPGRGPARENIRRAAGSVKATPPCLSLPYRVSA